MFHFQCQSHHYGIHDKQHNHKSFRLSQATRQEKDVNTCDKQHHKCSENRICQIKPDKTVWIS